MHKGRMAQAAELAPVRVNLGDQLVIDIELQMVAVGADYSVAESDRFVSARPAERRLQHNFLLWVALRFIEARGRLGLAKDVSYAVVTNTVARAKIGMRVVIEGAPAKAAGILRI